MQEVEPEMPFW